MNRLFVAIFSFLFIQNLFSSTKFVIKEEDTFHNKQIEFIKQFINTRKNFEISDRLIKLYYKNHNYETFFIKNNSIKPLAFELIQQIENDEVLKPNLNNFFNLSEIKSEINTIKETPDLKNLVILDFKLVSIYHRYMLFLSKGSIDWETFEEQLEKLKEEEDIKAYWEKYSAGKNIRKLLYKAVESNNMQEAFKEVDYNFLRAKILAQKIKEYEEIEKTGGLIKIPLGKTSLKKGNFYPQIKALKQRLLQTNYINTSSCNDSFFENDKKVETVKIDKDTASINFENNTNFQNGCEDFYDEKLFEAVKIFQKNNGLNPDGIIGKNTIKALNMPLEFKIKKMRLNLERMRWLPRNLGDEYIIVNIPDFSMKMYLNNEKILQMEAIVGEKEHPTPIFSHKMSEIVLNPYWKIPQSIVKKEIIPNLVKNPNYLQEEDIKVHENWDHDSVQYDTKNIDWSIFLDNDLIGDAKEAPMRFIQIPGDKNPLGRIKFMFPNRYSVYLHDTPQKYLFTRNNRAFSHGCIRLSNPKELLKTISQTNSQLKDSSEILKTKESVDINLDKKIPVHIVYLTSWVDENNQLQFRDDIYGYDKMQEEILYK